MLGINLAPIKYYGSQFPFQNFMKMRGPWRQNWSKSGNDEFTLDENGDIIALHSGGIGARVIPPVPRPHGTWSCFYDGVAKILFTNDQKIITPNHIEFEVLEDTKIVHIRIKDIDPDNPPRNIRVFPPGVTEEGWNPKFLDFLKPFNPLRFMEWQETTNSKVSDWEDRRPEAHITQAMNIGEIAGASIGTMVSLCNATNKSPWFCIPHKATDDYVRKFAEQTFNELNSSLDVYLEYTNEAWAKVFDASHYMIAEAERIGGLGGKSEHHDGWRFYSKRALEIFAIWEEIFGDRLIKILGSHDQRSVVSTEILDYNDAYKSVDALAIAPYFGGQPTGDPIDWTLDQILQACRDPASKHGIPAKIKVISEQKAIAEQRGVSLYAYEGGQGLVGIELQKWDPVVNDLFDQVQSHPEMGVLYTEYLNAWKESSGDSLFCHFNSILQNSPYGRWGLIEHMDQGMTPKLNAVLDFIATSPLPEPEPEPEPVPLLSDRFEIAMAELTAVLTELIRRSEE